MQDGFISIKGVLEIESYFESIGFWSEIKLDIIENYAVEYSKIMSAQEDPSFEHIYIDAFAGSGVNISRTSGKFVLGSPLRALEIIPPFSQLYFIDLDGVKVEILKEMTANISNVHIMKGDANTILHTRVFPNVIYKEYKRALCLLDPYGLHINWDIIQEACDMKSIEIFLNFPVMDMNRNIF